MTAITAVTAQNTVGVRSVHAVPPDAIVDQVRAVAEDIGVDAVKIGMLGTVETIGAVEAALDLVGGVPVVLDPVMVAESGALLLDDGALAALRERLVPRVSVVTPNVPEAQVIAEGAAVAERGGDARGSSHGTSGMRDAEDLVRAIHALGPGAVVVTGGHRADANDLFFDGRALVPIPGQRHPDGAAHGSGCTHSSALAAHLALGLEPVEAARVARIVAADAVRDGLRDLGAGAGPVDALGIARRRAPADLPAGRRRGL